MFVDSPDTLRAYGGGAAALVPASAAAAVDAPDAFVARLALACGLDAALWRVTGETAAEPEHVTLLVCRGQTVSPYAALRDLTAAGLPLPGPVACVTLAGGALQGQHGRRWLAVEGNLHLSVAWPCDLDAASCAPSLPMLPAVAACEAVASFAAAPAAAPALPGIKWVNDVVLRDGKLGGVLTAARAQGARVTTVFFGLGLNLAAAPALPADPFALPAVALPDAGTGLPLPRATAVVLARLRHRLAALAADGPEALVGAYRQRSVVIGREVGIWPETARLAAAAAAAAGSAPAGLPAPARRGRVVSVEPDLSLRLAGQSEPVREGCLRLLDGPLDPGWPGVTGPPEAAGPRG